MSRLLVSCYVCLLNEVSGGLCWCLGKYQATQNQTFKGIEASPPCSRVSILRHSNHTFFHHSLNAVNTGERIIITSNVTFPRARCHFRLLRCPLLWQTPPSPDHHCCTRFSAWRWFFFHPLSAYITSELTVLRGLRMVFHQASCLFLFVSQRWQNSFVINEQHPHPMEGANQFLFYICSISSLVQPTDA